MSLRFYCKSLTTLHRVANKSLSFVRCYTVGQETKPDTTHATRADVKPGKLCTNASLLYVSEKMKKYARPAGEKPFTALIRFRKEYGTLSATAKAPYEAKAAANRAARVAAQDNVKSHRGAKQAKLCTNASLLYVSEKMKDYARPAGETVLCALGRFRKEYGTLSATAKAPYEAKAAANRAAGGAAQDNVKTLSAKQGKLCTNASLLYVSEKIKKYARPAGEKPFTALIRFRKEYGTLSATAKAPYEAKAAANRAAGVAAKDKVKGARISPYALFVKENYKEVSAGISGTEGSTALSAITKEISSRWRALSKDKYLKYVERAKLLKSVPN